MTVMLSNVTQMHLTKMIMSMNEELRLARA